MQPPMANRISGNTRQNAKIERQELRQCVVRHQENDSGDRGRKHGHCCQQHEAFVKVRSAAQCQSRRNKYGEDKQIHQLRPKRKWNR